MRRPTLCLGILIRLVIFRKTTAFLGTGPQSTRRTFVSHVVTEERKSTEVQVVENSVGRRMSLLRRNGRTKQQDSKGEPILKASVVLETTGAQPLANKTVAVQAENLAALEDLANLIEEINKQVSEGTAMLLENLTEAIDDKLVRLPEKSAAELTTYLSDFTKEIQKAQQMELQRQLAEIDKRFIRPLEDLAFSDVPLLESKTYSKSVKAEKDVANENEVAPPTEFIVLGANSTLEHTRGMRTKDILKNFNVAPFYYSIALLTRWVRKASYPSVYLISIYRSLASVVKSNTKPRRKDRSVGGESMQAGWKRTGEIASKGPLAKKWAIMRRSAEIWSYFSSFYLKDRRITAKYNSGQWSEERFKKERSILGAEITQNLLKLGPVSVAQGC